MTGKRRQELEDIGLEMWKIQIKLKEILKEEEKYADSLDELDDDEYFERRFVEDTVEILKSAIDYCGQVADKVDEAREEYDGGKKDGNGSTEKGNGEI